MLKAIETRYKGYRFRSRLEARWAVFFDALSIKWEYEVEGFDLGDAGLYLPDFWLPNNQYWVEIKGKPPTQDELEKVKILSNENNVGAMLIAGTPEEEIAYLWDGKAWLIAGFDTSKKDIYSFDVWCELSCHEFDHNGWNWNSLHARNLPNTCPRIRHAYAAARSARF